MSSYHSRITLPATHYERACDHIVRKVEIDEHDCWVWQGTKIAGYGKLKLAGKQFYAHRVSAQLFHETFDPTLVVMHECPHGHNRSCINPWHLKQGTQSDNMNHPETVEKLRQIAMANLAKDRPIP